LQIILDDDTTLALAPSTQLELQTVVPEGKPEFKAHISSGLARFITGKIVEKNPGGFKISTPEGTVGIRGTMGALQTESGVTKAYNINSSRILEFNGIPLLTGEMVAVGSGIQEPKVERISEKEMESLDQRTASGVGGGGVTVASDEEGQGDSAFTTADANTAPVSEIARMSTIDMGGLDFITQDRTAQVTGAAGATSTFGFLANLTSGKVSDGWILFSGFAHYINGTGTIGSSSFHVGNFSNTGYMSGSSSEATLSTLDGTYSITGNTLTIDSGATFVRYGGGNTDTSPIISGSGTIQP
jgi:FecR protein.